MVFKPSKYQKAIFEWTINNTTQNAVVEAVAGSGKTTTTVKTLEFVDGGMQTVFLAFNKHIAIELQNRLPATARAMTYHSLGFAAIRKNFGKVNLDEDKVQKIVYKMIDRYSQGHLISPIKRLVSLCKNNLLLNPSYDLLNDLAYYHQLDLNGSSNMVFDMVSRALQANNNQTNSIDFDDMVSLPSFLNFEMSKYDFLAIDELQDTNAAQADLVMKSVSQNGRILGVGDTRQSIYAFRGADANAIANLVARTNAMILPLSISYRCPRSVVQLVNQEFPDIKFEASDTAIEGKVEYIKESAAATMFAPNDMILCRTNAPLVSYCFQLIRDGYKAIIKGRDIGKGIIALMDKMKTDDVNDCIAKLNDYQMTEGERLAQSGKFGLLQAMDDKVTTAIALLMDCKTVSEARAKTEQIFSDENAAITLSSIHRAKGLEANRVFVLHPELLPHPMAKLDWMKVSENNVKYVCFTRALQELYIVQAQ